MLSYRNEVEEREYMGNSSKSYKVKVIKAIVAAREMRRNEDIVGLVRGGVLSFVETFDLEKWRRILKEFYSSRFKTSTDE